jgi:hypothetical protein
VHRSSFVSLLAVAAAAVGLAAVPAAAQANAHIGFDHIHAGLHQRHPAVPTQHVLVNVCLRNTHSYGHAVTASVRSNFLLETRYTRDHLWSPTFHWNAGATGQRCERYWVIGVAADVERRLRFHAQDAHGVTWIGPREAGPGFRA